MTVRRQRAGRQRRWTGADVTRRAFLETLVIVAASLGASGASASQAPVAWPDTLLRNPFSTLAAAAVPAGYWVDVDESGATASASLGGSGSLVASGQGNVNYGWAQECAASGDGGPFSAGNYPPATCAQLGRPYNASGSPEQPAGFWFTGNQNCVNAGRPFSGAAFTWHVQLPQTGQWHVEVYIPSWTSYGWGNQYTLTAADGQFQNYPLTQQSYHGQWVNLFAGHQFTANQDYTVTLSLADGADSYCHYQMADQMKWVYDGAPTTTPTEPPASTPTEPPASRKIALPAPEFPPVSTIPPDISGEPIQGETLAEHHGSWLDSPNTFSYQWQRCDGSGGGCATIPGATQPTYTPTASDIGHMVAVQEIASNAGGAGSAATSKATGPVLPALHPNARLHARILAAARRLAHHHGARVQLTVTLSGAIAESAGVSPGTQLSGIGVVDFARRRASWSLPLPASLGGGRLNAIVGPSGAYVQLGQVTSTAAGKWIHVGSAQLAEIPRFGFVGALALLLNPDGAVALLKSTTREVAQVGRSVASASGTPGAPVRTQHAAAASMCSATPGIDSVQTALDPSKLVGVVKDTKATLREIHSTTSQIRMIAGLGPTGALGAIQMVDQEGLTISGRYCSTEHPADGATPPAASLTSARSWFALDPCLVGRWILAGPLLGPSGYPIAAGQTALEISPVGEASLTYVEHTFPYPPLPKETFYGLPDPLGGPDAVGVFGSASLTVAAPLATKDTAHRIVWSIIGDTVHQIFSGNFIEGSEIPGYEIFYPPPLEPLVVEPIVTPPFDIPPMDSPVGPSGVVVSDYECNPEDPIFKTGTLKTTQPIGNKVELKFLRATPIYKPPAH